MKSDRPSSTALLIAKSQLMLADDPALNWTVGLERARVYSACVSAVTSARWRLTALARLYLRLGETVGVPGIYLHYALRKLCIEEIVKALLAAHKIQQIVVVAAGFDPLCTLQHRVYPEAQWFELDHPATQRYKRSALSHLSADGNLTLLPIDLTQQPVSALYATGQLPRHRPTLVIAEGITMYLSEDQIRTFFGQIRECTAGESFLLFTYMNRDAKGFIDFGSSTSLAGWWLAFKRERFVWGIEAARLAPFLEAMRFSLAGHWDSNALRDAYLKVRGFEHRPLASGENIALARIEAQAGGQS